MSEDRGRERPVQEPDRLPGRSAAAWVAGTVLAVVVLTASTAGFLRWTGEGFFRPPPAPSAEPPGALDPTDPLRLPFGATTFRAAPDSATRARLESYRWVDREGGVVSVPVERAGEILIRRQAVAEGGDR